IPGFYADIDTGRPGPKILVFGELDGLLIPNHPECDKETGAVHACGHNAQCAALLGLAAALREEGVLDGLCGSVRLCAVPAEEGIELGYRRELQKAGVIKFLSGKSEFIARGYFDDCDIAFMVHTTGGDPGRILCGLGNNGVIVKNIVYKGKAAHAGGSPHNGINALYAANVGLSAVNALRETFLDSESIRFHPIMTEGGSSVNAIPDRAVLESYVRGRTIEALTRENKKINRALAGGAAALGASLSLSDSCGYFPNKNDLPLREAAKRAALKTVPPEKVVFYESYSAGSTDMGDVSSLMPSLHPYAAGSSGAAHGNAYYIVDPVFACVVSAEYQLRLITELLSDNALEAKKITDAFTPVFKNSREYVDYLSALDHEFEAVSYNEDGSITINV
ncbi:MAG: M20/M25/M40 family metallo-hydrolase, partial [Clostridia bacterium]|nr:M20/M25/M40 family metallo-hydrolase [Clostridia bacterium]